MKEKERCCERERHRGSPLGVAIREELAEETVNPFLFQKQKHSSLPHSVNFT